MEQVYVTKSIDGQAINRLKSRFALKNKFANQIFLRVGIFSILFGLLFLPLIGEAQIQTYGTPVNTIMKENPFLDASTYFNNVNGSAGKGLVFPQTNLTLFTFKTTNLDGLLFPTAFDGMIVYNIGTGNTQAGQGVVTAVTPGFYYFSNPSASTTVTNGKWIRIANANDLGTTPSGAAFPVTANPGDVFYNTATKNYYYYKDTEWIAVSSVPSGAAAPAAGSSKVGDLYYETNANPALSILKIFNGTAWVSIGGSSLTDGSVTASKLQASGGGALPDGGGANFVLQSNGDGTFSWLDISTGVPVDPNSLSLPTGQLYVGNGSGKAAATAKNAIPISGFGTATADVALGGFKITGLATPTLATDAATMGYVDGKVPSFVAGDANKVLSINGTGTGTVWTTPATGGITSVSVASANGFSGTSSGGATPALTLGTSVNGLVKGNGTAISAAVAGTDYIAPGANSLTIGTGANAVTLSAPTAGSGAYNLVLPTNEGTADYVLKTDGSGVLRWDVDATGAAGGGITSIGLSLPLLYNPFTTLTADGSFTGTLATQAANTVFAGPSSGGNAAPTFRVLAATDIPALDWAKITTGKPTTLAGYGITDAATAAHTHTFASLTSKPTTIAGYGITDAMSNPMSASGDIVYGGASGAPTRLAAGTNGQVLTLAGGVPTWAAGGGLSAIANNTMLGNVSGAAAVPTALSAAQIKTLLSLSNVENTALSTWTGSTNITTLGTIGTGTWNGTTIAVNRGGTGATTATGALNALLPAQTGNGGRVLQTDGTNASWSAAGTGTVTSVAASGGTTGLTVSGGPITTTGTLTLGGTLAIGSGGTGATTAAGALTALGAAPLASPALTGTPTAPTAALGTNTTQIATTAFVLANGGSTPNATTTTLGKIQLAGDLGGTATSPTVPGLATKAPLASPALTGTPTAPTAALGTNTTQIATTAFVLANGGSTPNATTTTLGKIQLAGDLGGTAASPTVPGLATKAPLASPALTGTPTAPTAALGNNTTQIATTAFVTAAVAAGGGGGGSTLYSADGTITADRTVTQAANVDLTFANSGTGRTVMDGALQINGTMYITSYRVATNLAEAAVRDTDYIIEIQISGAQTLTSVLPDPTTVPVGRVIVFRNSSARAGTGGNYTFGAPDSGYIVAATVIINSNLSMTLVCDGSKWVRIWE